jgi:hypothetical protein
MRTPLLIAAALMLGLLACTGLSAADAAPQVVPAGPETGLTGNPTVDLILALVGIVNTFATALAALLPGNSAIGWIARLANLANSVGVTLKPKAVQPKNP